MLATLSSLPSVYSDQLMTESFAPLWALKGAVLTASTYDFYIISFWNFFFYWYIFISFNKDKIVLCMYTFHIHLVHTIQSFKEFDGICENSNPLLLSKSPGKGCRSVWAGMTRLHLVIVRPDSDKTTREAGVTTVWQENTTHILELYTLFIVFCWSLLLSLIPQSAF